MDDKDLIVDEYSHLSPQLIYSLTHLLGPGGNVIEFECQLTGCQCVEGCSESDCQCIGHCGPNYSSDKLLLPEKWSAGGVLECNSQCLCDPLFCTNRVLQVGPQKGLNIFECKNAKGLGLRTKEVIKKGAFICEYAGEVIGMVEAKKRFKEISENRSMNYIFVLREIVPTSNSEDNVIETIVDPTVFGNIGRYINHSCDPNAGIVPVRIDCGVPKLGVFALKDISAGEEITYDYSGGVAKGQQLSKIPLGLLKQCFCGANNCSGYLPCDISLL